MHTQESCMFLDIVLVLSVQEYSRNPKNKVKNNDSLHAYIYIYKNTFIYEKLPHVYETTLENHLLYFFHQVTSY